MTFYIKKIQSHSGFCLCQRKLHFFCENSVCLLKRKFLRNFTARTKREGKTQETFKLDIATFSFVP